MSSIRTAANDRAAWCPTLFRTAFALAVLQAVALGATTFYVDAGAPPGQDGSSWAKAFASLQVALDAAHPGAQIRVADGTYLPTHLALASDPRSATFALADGVMLRGGYAGAGAADPDERDPLLHPSILSGDIGAPSVAFDNALHVVSALGTDATAVLDGFTIRDGRADGGNAQDQSGGGLLIVDADPTVRDCTILGNSAGLLGGGIWIQGGSPEFSGCSLSDDSVTTAGGGGIAGDGTQPVLTDCTFDDCSSGAGGGGAINLVNSELTLVRCSVSNCSSSAIQLEGGSLALRDCEFTGNTGRVGGAIRVDAGNCVAINCAFLDNLASGRGIAGGRGGAIGLTDTAASVINCRFHGNQAVGGLVDGGRGGALQVTGGTVAVVECLFTGNVVDSALITTRDGGRGGAVSVEAPGQLSAANCTLSGNRAITQPGGLNGSVVGGIDGLATIRNTILSGNTDSTGGGEEAQVSFGASLQSCCVDGWTGVLGGGGNFAGPALFVDADGADNVAGTLDDDLHLQPTSPCIDAGDNAGVPADLFDCDGDGVQDAPLPVDLDGIGRFADDLSVADTGVGVAPIVDLGVFERSAWANLGQPLAGVLGDPLLVGAGAFAAGETLSVRVTRARPDSLAWLLVGPTELNQPFHGGVLVPNPYAPGFAIVMLTDALGVASAEGTWPPASSGIVLEYQCWLLDPAGVQGCSASNAVASLSP